jgi:hypothetical protein
MVSVTPIPGCRSEFAAVLRCRLCPHRLLPRSAWIRFITCRKAVAQSNTIAPQAPNAQDPHSTSVRTGDSSGSSDRTAAGPSAMLIGRLVDRLSRSTPIDASLPCLASLVAARRQIHYLRKPAVHFDLDQKILPNSHGLDSQNRSIGWAAGLSIVTFPSARPTNSRVSSWGRSARPCQVHRPPRHVGAG